MYEKRQAEWSGKCMAEAMTGNCVKSISSEESVEEKIKAWHESVTYLHPGIKVQKILTDKGKNFIGKTFVNFCGEHKIAVYKSTAYYPQGDGIPERAIQSVSAKMRLLYQSDVHSKFDQFDIVRLATEAFNNCPSSTTGDRPTQW
jgi:hypothetical protein